MRPVAKGGAPAGVAVTEYRQWRDHLIARIGTYCAYCGMVLEAGDVEHVCAKVHAGVDELAWDNLLLSCAWCNRCKGTKVGPHNWRQHLWPDIDNTAAAYQAGASGELAVRPGLDGQGAAAAASVISLCQINRARDTSGNTDPRWRKRGEAWVCAKLSAQRLAQNRTPQQVDAEITVAQKTGFWYIWVQVFADDPDMLGRLTDAFPGTYPDWQSPTPRGLI